MVWNLAIPKSYRLTRHFPDPAVFSDPVRHFPDPAVFSDPIRQLQNPAIFKNHRIRWRPNGRKPCTNQSGHGIHFFPAILKFHRIKPYEISGQGFSPSNSDKLEILTYVFSWDLSCGILKLQEDLPLNLASQISCGFSLFVFGQS